MHRPMGGSESSFCCSHSFAIAKCHRAAAKCREVNELKTRSRPRSLRRFLGLAAALLVAALVAIPTSNLALAQSPPGPEIVLVNTGREFVERKGGGQFVARPVFDRKIVNLFHAVRDADTGDWITAMYRVQGGEKHRSDGWEYSWEYPKLSGQPDLDKDKAYLLVMLAEDQNGNRGDFYAVVPIHQPGRIWDKILAALNPGALGQGLRRLGDRGQSTGPSAAWLSGRPARTPTTAGGDPSR